uniref:Uncharacterized protein n=1 Tax=Solanum lycopersicum TaxID=4081 RepID=A0A3Q7IZV4_SOLLC
MSKQYLANLALKVNVKVGGRNFVLVNAISRQISLGALLSSGIISADMSFATKRVATKSNFTFKIFLSPNSIIELKNPNEEKLMKVFFEGPCQTEKKRKREDDFSSKNRIGSD